MRFVIYILFILSSGLNAAPYQLHAITEETPPHTYYDTNTQKAADFVVEVVEELLKRTDTQIVDNRIKVYPWARGYHMLETQPNVMLFETTRSPKREHLFKWVGPVAPRVKWLWKLKKRDDIQANTLSEATQFVVGGVRGFSSAEQLEQLGFKIEYSNQEDTMYKKFFSGRVDLVNATELVAAHHVKQYGYEFSAIEKLIPFEDRYDYYLAFNKQVPDEIIHKLQQALGRMFMDGTYTRIRQPYLE
ncbi:substrate-binding periplasmic protein [Neptuniibacter sp. QD29_5]|uniref:substrate-binding periplasmic protein n=1 Tax=Neptuniibacter sp. QD29_5 TaxID=3398207 RepID=UPI0039F46895